MELVDYVGSRPEIVKSLSKNRWTGCWTREALDLLMLNIEFTDEHCVVYWDADGVKQLNLIYGKIQTSLRFRAFGRSGQDIVGHWFSGDEMICILRRDEAMGFIDRMSELLAEVGMSATFAVSGTITEESIDLLDQIVDDAKKAGMRGYCVSSDVWIGYTETATFAVEPATGFDWWLTELI